MMSSLRQWIEDVRSRARIALFTYEGRRLYCRTFVYAPRTQELSLRHTFRLHDIDTVVQLRLVWWTRFVCAVIFFPFPYRVVVSLPGTHAYSAYETVTIERDVQHTAPLGREEFRQAFSHYIGKFVDENRKRATAQTSLHDADVLLVHNHIVHVRSGNQYYALDGKELFSDAPRTLEVGVIQTFVPRSLFSHIVALLPRRARVYAWAQEGFHLAYALYRGRMEKRTSYKHLPLGVAWVRNSITQLYRFDGKRLSFHDSFLFGSRMLYEALHNELLIDKESFLHILSRYKQKTLSVHMRTLVANILEQETMCLLRGIDAFKKPHHLSAVYLNPGVLEEYLSLHPRTRQSVIGVGQYAGVHTVPVRVDHSCDHVQYADCVMGLGLYHHTPLSAIGKESIRWLLPHTM